jgi:protein associated with RNAse G/E
MHTYTMHTTDPNLAKVTTGCEISQNTEKYKIYNTQCYKYFAHNSYSNVIENTDHDLIRIYFNTGIPAHNSRAVH